MDLQFRRGTAEDAELFIQFLNNIKAEMPQKAWLYLDPPEVVHSMIADGTMSFWLAMDGEAVAGVFSVLYPGLRSDNYGYDLDFTDEELLQVVHMDTAAVHRNYRGFGLQKQMALMAETMLTGQGRRILLCTVHPDNSFSLNNMLQQGYEVQKCIGKYDSERLLLRKNIF